MPPSTQAQSSQNMSPQQQNLLARNLIVHGGMGYPAALNMWQALNPSYSTLAAGSIVTQQLRNVGYVKRLLVHITAEIAAGGVTPLTLTNLGLSNLVSQVVFNDLGNNQRLNTTGWHLIGRSTVMRRRPFGAAMSTDTPFGYGSNIIGAVNTTNLGVQYAPTTIPAGDTAMVSLMLEIPFSISDHDLTGVIFADVTQATMQAQLTINPTPFVAAGADATLAVYQSGGADLGTISNISVQIYQNYLDQYPRYPNGQPILPAIDMGNALLMNNTTSGLPVANQDYTQAFTNARKFQSVMFFYDNNGVLNPATDITYISIQSANLTNIIQIDPYVAALFARNIIGDDMPVGGYYLDFRDRPIDTNQYGNMQLVIRPSNVGGSNSNFLYGFESTGTIGLVNQGGSIPSGGAS